MTLTDNDKASAAWAKLLAHFNERLAYLRTQNDGDHDERKTAELRGRIAEIKALISLKEDSPVITQ